MQAACTKQADTALRLKKLRASCSPLEVAQAVGVSVRTYQRWEEGHRIAPRNLARLAQLHGVSASWLLDGTPDQPASRSLAKIEARLDELHATVAAATQRRDGLFSALTAELKSRVAEIGKRVAEIEERQRLIVEASDLTLPGAGPSTSQRLDGLEAKIQTLLELALEQQLELAAGPGVQRGSDTSAVSDESRR